MSYGEVYGPVLRAVSKWKAAVFAFFGRHTAAGNFLRALKNTCLSMRYQFTARRCHTEKQTVLFCSFEGGSYSDSPKAIFEYMVSCGDYEDWTFVWAFRKNPDDYREKLKRRTAVLKQGTQGRGAAYLPADDAGKNNGAHGANVIIVSYDSSAFRKYLASAGYWVLNYKIKDYLKPKKDQVFLQCWHGTPLKRLGYDLDHFDHPMNTAAGLARHYGIEVRKFTYFISPSPFASEKFRSAWRMDAFGKHDIILETGYPRNDILVKHTQEDIRQAYGRVFGVHAMMKTAEECKRNIASGRKIVLYAPTYRQDQYDAGSGYTYGMPLDPACLQAALGNDVMILFRAHYYITNRIDFESCRGFLYDVSDVDDINDLYLISDILVTDYSSAMFDFALLRRPMIFYMYDLEYYRDVSNGFYFDPAGVLPGPIVSSQEELTAALRSAACAGGKREDVRYQKFLDTFCPNEDGHAAERVVGKVF